SGRVREHGFSRLPLHCFDNEPRQHQQLAGRCEHEGYLLDNVHVDEDDGRGAQRETCEYDLSTCTQIRARGTVPPGILRKPMSAFGKSRGAFPAFGKSPIASPAFGKSPAAPPSFFGNDVSYSMGEQNSGAVAGDNITTEYRWQGWM